MKKIFTKIPLWIVLVACIAPGLTPFFPPHLYEKTLMLIQGELTKPLDLFDLLFHGSPWVILGIKLLKLKNK